MQTFATRPLRYQGLRFRQLPPIRQVGLAQRLAATNPQRYVTGASPARRRGHIFIDYLRNGRGTTAIGTYSPRARRGFPIAAPVSWRQVEHGVQPDAYTMAHPFVPAYRKK